MLVIVLPLSGRPLSMPVMGITAAVVGITAAVVGLTAPVVGIIAAMLGLTAAVVGLTAAVGITAVMVGIAAVVVGIAALVVGIAALVVGHCRDDAPPHFGGCSPSQPQALRAELCCRLEQTRSWTTIVEVALSCFQEPVGGTRTQKS